MRKQIGLLSDFGTKDGYVASMKGVIVSICDDCTIIDLSHDITPQNVTEAALFLESCCEYFPEGFIFLVVVDPGVGTARRILCLQTEQNGQIFIAPDNGVLDLVVKQQGVNTLVSIENPQYWRETTSSTFHGRDIMSPVAAHIAAGTNIDDLGPAVDPATMLPLNLPRKSYIHVDGVIAGALLIVDHFGNVITNISTDLLNEAAIEIDDILDIFFVKGKKVLEHLLVPYKSVYADVEPGEFVCLLNSENRFEIAINQGNAGRKLTILQDITEILVKKHARS
ncbi:MAG TPA: SAM-dependent chlorinase/fluorinase [Candidatus Lokiarchaeia archaeon]|nr:SAM-dependent chlorinase/fluorinase [Candidatus Lokiarchaeia archaeon]